MSMILVAVVWIQFSHKLRRSDGLTAVDPEPEAST